MFSVRKIDWRDPNSLTPKHQKQNILAEKCSGSGRQWETYADMNQNVKYARPNGFNGTIWQKWVKNAYGRTKSRNLWVKTYVKTSGFYSPNNPGPGHWSIKSWFKFLFSIFCFFSLGFSTFSSIAISKKMKISSWEWSTYLNFRFPWF